jgi:hypothetical protein
MSERDMQEYRQRRALVDKLHKRLEQPLGTLAQMELVQRVLSEGGKVVFNWKDCDTRLIEADGNWFGVDGRTYQGFLKTLAPKLQNVGVPCSRLIPHGFTMMQWAA